MDANTIILSGSDDIFHDLLLLLIKYQALAASFSQLTPIASHRDNPDQYKDDQVDSHIQRHQGHKHSAIRATVICVALRSLQPSTKITQFQIEIVREVPLWAVGWQRDSFLLSLAIKKWKSLLYDTSLNDSLYQSPLRVRWPMDTLKSGSWMALGSGAPQVHQALLIACANCSACIRRQVKGVCPRQAGFGWAYDSESILALISQKPCTNPD